MEGRKQKKNINIGRTTVLPSTAVFIVAVLIVGIAHHYKTRAYSGNDQVLAYLAA